MNAARSPKTFRRTFGILFVVLIILVLAGLGTGVLPNPWEEGADHHSHEFKTVSVQRGDIDLRVAETGYLEPQTVVEIKSEVSGKVKKLFVKAGDKVRPGDRLAVIQLEPALARQAADFRANAEAERLNVEEARREVERLRALAEKGFIPQQELETAEKKLETAQIRHTLVQRQLFLLLGGNQEVYDRYLGRDLSSEVLDEFVITSPASGTIIEIDVEEGELISSGTSSVTGGTALMKISDLRKMLVKSKINEVNIAQVQVGMPVEIRLDALPGRLYQGVVTGISPQGEKEDNIVTYTVTVEIKNPEETLKPAMTANVDILANTFEDVLYLPLEALGREGTKDIVYVEEEGRKTAKPVEVLFKTANQAIIAEGLGEGQAVILPE